MQRVVEDSVESERRALLAARMAAMRADVDAQVGRKKHSMRLRKGRGRRQGQGMEYRSSRDGGHGPGMGGWPGDVGTRRADVDAQVGFAVRGKGKGRWAWQGVAAMLAEADAQVGPAACAPGVRGWEG